MSKTFYSRSADAAVPRFGEWLRRLREERRLPLRAVAEAAGMDLAHLHKIELGQRLPTVEQTTALAKFYKKAPEFMEARRIAEKFRMDNEDNPAAYAAIQMLAEQAHEYKTRK